ncbi:hypothetical protein C8R43DRAFT_1117040 [Mycena crocata]|nr:hypothetical protein C8R43DRAFT_1117040 [Mycena crocata]
MPVVPTEHVHCTPASKRSPTQRHMHNYSLPSPSYAPRPTTPRPARCQSSPTLSEFRQALYIPSTLPESKQVAPRDGSARGPPRHLRLSSRSTHPDAYGPSDSPSALRAATSDPGISLLAYVNGEGPPRSIPVPTSCGNPTSPSIFSSSSSTASSTRHPRTPPSTPTKAKIDHPKPNRLSALSLASLSFPLPPSPVIADFNWDIDPFASSSDSPASRWSPASSTLELTHQPKSSTASKNEQSAFEKLKDMPSPTRLKDFFGRLSINRSPIATGFHFRSQSASKLGQQKQSRRPDSLMTFVMVDEEKERLGPLIENVSQNDEVDVFETTLCLPIAGGKRGGNLDALGQELSGTERDSTQSESSTYVAASSPISSPEFDGIPVFEHSLISTSQIALPESLHGSPSPPPTMRTPSPNALATAPFDLASASSYPGSSYETSSKPRSNVTRGFAIPPSPRVAPPQPPTLPQPPFASGSVAPVLDLGFPSPPPLVPFPYSRPPSPPSTREINMAVFAVAPLPPSIRKLPPPPAPETPALLEVSPLQIQKVNCIEDECFTATARRPPPIPPRSRLRPKPVKISTNFNAIQATVTRMGSEQCMEIASPAHSHSSSIGSLIISPLPSPPLPSHSSSLHSHASSVASFMVSPLPTPPHHSHSSSVASSIISPMPTPPSLSPTSPLSPSTDSDSSPVAIPNAHPATSEPQLDLGALKRLILRRGGRSSTTGSDPENENDVGQSVAEIARARKSDSDESSACTATIPESAWQEEPRSPPSRISFYNTFDRAHSASASDLDDDDDAASIYSQFSTTYNFRSRSRTIKSMRSARRARKNGRMSSRMSMMSVYSQASFSSQEAMDLPPLPALPWALGDPVSDVAEDPLARNDLGEMTSNAPEYAYAYSLDDYVGHGLEGMRLAGRIATRSGRDFETVLPLPPLSEPELATLDQTASWAWDDWRTLLTEVKGKRRTSSNISVVGNALPILVDPFTIETTDVCSLATTGSIDDVSTTSTVTPATPRALLPNRRQRTIRRTATNPPSSLRSHCPPPSSTSVNFIFDAESDGGWRRDSLPPDMASKSEVGITFPSLGSEDNLKKARGVRSGLTGMRSRVSVLKSRLASITSRSPSSPTFPPGYRGTDDRAGATPLLSPYPPARSHWAPQSLSSSPSSPSSSSGGSTSGSPSSASSWTHRRDAMTLSPSAAPSTGPIAI